VLPLTERIIVLEIHTIGTRKRSTAAKRPWIEAADSVVGPMAISNGIVLSFDLSFLISNLSSAGGLSRSECGKGRFLLYVKGRTTLRKKSA
jgi:hypothetical protein